jgi:hypothetical protein
MIQRLLAAIGGVSFNRGLALGAFVGAAIAGSTLWSRIRAAREGPLEASADELPEEPSEETTSDPRGQPE